MTPYPPESGPLDRAAPRPPVQPPSAECAALDAALQSDTAEAARRAAGQELAGLRPHSLERLAVANRLVADVADCLRLPDRGVRVKRPRRYVRVTGDARLELADDLVAKYEAGASIRNLAAELGKSYGFVHALLTDGGVTFRRRGGIKGVATRPRKTEETPRG